MLHSFTLCTKLLCVHHQMEQGGIYWQIFKSEMRGWDLFRKERLYKGLRLRYRPSVRSGCLSVCPWQETPNPQMWFLGSSCNFKLLSFLKFPFSAVFVTLSSFSPVFCHLCFFAFRNVSCYLECSKFISPKWFFTCKIFFTELWVKQGGTLCYQAFSFRENLRP